MQRMLAGLGALALVWSLALSAAVAGETNTTGKKRIGVSIPTADHGWTGGINYWAKRAVEDWKQRDPELEFLLVAAENSAKQIADIEDLLAQGIDALVVLAHDSAPLTPVVKTAHERGVYVVSVDRGLVEQVEDVYIAGDNPGLGRVAGEWIGEQMKGKGNLVMLTGIPCVIDTERSEAFLAVMKEKYPNIKILDSQPAHWDTQKGLTVMENFLQKYPRIDAVFAQDDDVLAGVLQAYKESGRDDIHTFLGGAGSKVMIKKAMDGDPLVRATVTYPPNMVATGVSLGVWGVRGHPLSEVFAAGLTPGDIEGFYQKQLPAITFPDADNPVGRVILAAELVTADNAASYYEPASLF